MSSPSEKTDLTIPTKEIEEDADGESAAGIQLNEAISVIGPGPYQLIVLCLAGGVYTAEGSLLLMLSVIAKSLIIRWKLSALFAGAMVSIIFCGLLFGTIIGGFLCDRYGRRMPILVTYFGMTLFLILSLLSPDLLLLISCKFMLGVSLGFGVPAASAMVIESCPSSHRSNAYCMTMVMFSLGQMYSACILWAMSPEIDHATLSWRLMLGLAATLPFILGTLSYFFLLESPHWLLAQCRYTDARDVVLTMAAYKGTVPPEIMEEFTDEIQTPAHHTRAIEDFSLQDETDSPRVRKIWMAFWLKLENLVVGMQEDSERLQQLFSEKFMFTTTLMSFICFTTNFAYYGMIYGLPDTLKEGQSHGHGGGHGANWSPAAGVFLSAVFEIPGVFVAILLGTTVSRKTNMTISFGLTLASLIAVILVLSSGRMDNAGLIAVFATKLFIASVFIVVYLYLLECYPTKFRATGLAFCMVVGRFGAFLCPFLFDGLHIMGYSHRWFFVVMAVLVGLSAICSMLLPYETKDAQLMEDEPPSPRKQLEVGPHTARLMSFRGFRHGRSNSNGCLADTEEVGRNSFATMSPTQKKAHVMRMQSA